MPLLAGIIVACVGLSWSMVPRHGELIERLVKDKQYERVVSVLENSVHGAQHGEVHQLGHLDPRQFAALSRLLNMTPREQLNAAFSSRTPPAYDAYVHSIVLAAVRYVDVMPPAEAIRIITPGIARVPEGMRVQLLQLLTRNALAVDRPDLAAMTSQQACESASSTWENAKDMVQDFRWSGQPSQALQQLKRWRSNHQHKLSHAQQEEADQLLYTLALESGNPSKALDLCLEELDALPTTAPPALMERAYQTALQSSRSKELLPHLAKFVEAMPESHLSLQEVSDLHTSNPEQFTAYTQWATSLAQWLDWNDVFDTAFHHHLRLAVLGNRESLERCLDLYEHLGRAEECAELLQIIGEVPEKPEYRLILARQLAELGRDDESKIQYEGWLKIKPRDRAALYDYGCLLEDMGDEPASLKAFEHLLSIYPEDVPGIKKLAEASIRAADYPRALELYKKLPEQAHDYMTLENYAMIAESLDDHAAEYRALQLQIASTPKPGIELYLDLAETAGYLQEAPPAINILAEAMTHHPESRRLRLALADAYMAAERSTEALACLMHSSMRGDFEASRALLSLSEHIIDAEEALQFIGPKVAMMPLNDHDRLELAVLQFRAGHREESDRLFKTVPETEGNLKLMAEARQQVGDETDAIRLMKLYLKDGAQGAAADWVFLGDLYEEAGLSEEARHAYDYSLALMTADLPGTAANTPAPTALPVRQSYPALHD